MDVYRAGETGHNHTVTQYVGPSEFTGHGGKMYLYDAGTGEIIAELTPEAADAVRARKPATIAKWDRDVLTMED